MEYHPDRNNGDKTKEEKLKKINEAYDTLGNETKRAEYNRILAPNIRQPANDYHVAYHADIFRGYDYYTQHAKRGQQKSKITHMLRRILYFVLIIPLLLLMSVGAITASGWFLLNHEQYTDTFNAHAWFLAINDFLHQGNPDNQSVLQSLRQKENIPQTASGQIPPQIYRKINNLPFSNYPPKHQPKIPAQP